jgi:hypothetical protein
MNVQKGFNEIDKKDCEFIFDEPTVGALSVGILKPQKILQITNKSMLLLTDDAKLINKLTFDQETAIAASKQYLAHSDLVFVLFASNTIKVSIHTYILLFNGIF